MRTNIIILTVFTVVMSTAAYFDNQRANVKGLSKVCLMETCIITNKQSKTNAKAMPHFIRHWILSRIHLPSSNLINTPS